MIRRAAMLAGCLACAAAARGQGWLDRLDESLQGTAWGDRLRGRLSGLADLEGYRFDGAAPGLIDTRHRALLNPRLTLFADAQAGSSLYFFGQARVDRGFDAGDGRADARAEEYALRWTPWEDGRASVQAGEFATVIGGWSARHLSWDNPFVSAPLPYEGATPVYDSEVVSSPADFLKGTTERRYEYSPVIWGPSYATGASVAGKAGWLEAAAEVKNASPSSRPESWPATDTGFAHPTVGGRVGLRPSPSWSLGMSGATGAYLRREVLEGLPEGRGLGDYREHLLGWDVRYEWHHVQVWAEAYAARFEVPRVGNADLLAYYVEAKQRVSPRVHLALRWNQMFYGRVPDGAGAMARWGEDLWRVDAAAGFRFTEHLQLKLQYSVQRATTGTRESSNTVSAQFTVRF